MRQHSPQPSARWLYKLRFLGAELGRRLGEWLVFDWAPARKISPYAGLIAGRLCLALGRPSFALALLTKAHRSGNSDRVCLRVEALLDRALETDFDSGPRPGLSHALRVRAKGVTPAAGTEKFFEDPTKLLRHRAIVLKSPGTREKGVLLLKYSYAFPLFSTLYDLPRIQRRYHLVLEPSWAGCCDPDILCYLPLAEPVFVQSTEPRDFAFLERTRGRLIPVPVSANWWVDHRIFAPGPAVPKDTDVIMVAGWGRYKRHHRFFAALRKLRRAGERLKVVLIGNPRDLTRADIEKRAEYFGVRDLVELYERLTHEELREKMRRAKLHLLWSRREGSPRTTLEAMLTGVPAVLREGFNYGQPQAYINSGTGCYSSEADLPGTLLRMIRDHDRFKPRQWVLDNMSCQRATDILAAVIRRHAEQAGESWSAGLAVKTNRSASMRYWGESEAENFEKDYEFLKSKIRG